MFVPKTTLLLNCLHNNRWNPKILNISLKSISSDQHTLFNFVENFKHSHIPTNTIQKAMLGLGSSFMSLIDPTRADMIAIMGETTGAAAIKYMTSQMETNPEGLRILRDKPVINSTTVDLEKLSKLPDGTLGRAYIDFLNRNKVTPDSRDMVRFVDNLEMAYVIQRYREVHDLVHTMLNMPTNMLGEVTVKWVEAFQTRLPLCVFGGLFGAVRLAPKQRSKYIKYYLPWAIETGLKSKFFMNVYFEERWEQPMENLLAELNIKPLVIKK